ncbi:biotin transporter BioY [Methanobacterium alcaliphilum]|uniref:biotin transporter BioY n=1 Tax=Methanobacterium alcaliphilum TaxID=392018 RepID=UPI00200B51EB|nr:biotin transporter BioY [Methanobacterium alcaliphilum]
MNVTLNNYYKKRYDLFKWRNDQSIAYKAVMAFFMACITGIMAQIIIPLPWTPVPITAQTFAVLISGVLLGRRWGGLSMLIYVTIGLLGVPWFAQMTGGLDILLGASGGYLIGFILASLFLGYFSDKYNQSRNFTPMLGLMTFASFVLIYVPGLIVLSFYLYSTQGNFPEIWTLLAMGVIPFLIGDALKIVGASALTKALLPKEQ